MAGYTSAASSGPKGKGEEPDATPAKADDKYSLGPYDNAESAYNHLRRYRTGVEDLGRLMAELTIPSLYPPRGYITGSNIPGNNQSLGARCVNTLASKLMFMAMPPGRPMMKFEVIEEAVKSEAEQQPELYSMVELALSRLEQAHRRRAATTSLRSAYVGAMKMLLVAGNVLWKHINLATPTHHSPDDGNRGGYVVQRDKEGNQLLVILKECVTLATLASDVKAFVLELNEELEDQPEWSAEVEIYSVCKLCTDPDTDEKTWCYWQEVEDEMIPGTSVETDFDVPPLYAAWLIPVYGQNWGRSYCEEYRGDLYSVENHAASLNDGAAASSLHLTFVKPGSRTSVKQIREAPNLSVLAGDAADVTTLKADKNQDYTFVSNNMQAAAQRLGFAFLLMQAIQRQAERVTAEEWQQMASELDEAMGGLYSELAQSFQRHVVQRFVVLHEESSHSLPKLDPRIVSIGVVTGIDALGRTVEGQALVQFGGTLEKIFGPQAVMSALNLGDFARRLAAAEGIQPKGLVRDQQETAASFQGMQQVQAKQTMLEKATGPAVKAMGEAVNKGIDPAQLQQAIQSGAQNPGAAPQLSTGGPPPTVQQPNQ